jgi:hypothetical protein
MNEPSSFDTNEVKPWNWQYPLNETERYPLFTLKCPINRLDDPPYRTSKLFVLMFFLNPLKKTFFLK